MTDKHVLHVRQRLNLVDNSLLLSLSGKPVHQFQADNALLVFGRDERQHLLLNLLSLLVINHCQAYEYPCYHKLGAEHHVAQALAAVLATTAEDTVLHWYATHIPHHHNADEQSHHKQPKQIGCQLQIKFSTAYAQVHVVDIEVEIRRQQFRHDKGEHTAYENHQSRLHRQLQDEVPPRSTVHTADAVLAYPCQLRTNEEVEEVQATHEQHKNTCHQRNPRQIALYVQVVEGIIA